MNLGFTSPATNTRKARTATPDSALNPGTSGICSSRGPGMACPRVRHTPRPLVQPLGGAEGQPRAAPRPGPGPSCPRSAIAAASWDGHSPAEGLRLPRDPGSRLPWPHCAEMPPRCCPGPAPAPPPGPISDVELPGPPLSRLRCRGALQSRESEEPPWNAGMCSRRRRAARRGAGREL